MLTLKLMSLLCLDQQKLWQICRSAAVNVDNLLASLFIWFAVLVVSALHSTHPGVDGGDVCPLDALH